MKEDHERVSNLLADTVTLLCRNGLQFKTEMKVQGLLGITLDDEVFLVQIDKKFSEMMGAELVSIQAEKDRAADLEDGGSDDSRAAPSRHRNRHRKKRRRTNEAGENSPASSLKESKVLIKSEPIQDDDDLILMESDTKPGIHDKNTMRQSYGMQYDNGLPSGSNQNLSNNDSPYITNIIKNSSQGMDDSQLGGDAGCSTWDGQISALTAGDGGSVLPHGGNSSGGDETLDQQTMSTVPSQEWSGRSDVWPSDIEAQSGVPPEPQSGGEPVPDYVDLYFERIKKRVYACNYPGCKSRYSHKNNLRTHQRKAGHLA